MKKPDINVDAIKQWGIEHGEKVALGLAGVFLLVFLWGVISAERFDRSRDELSTASEKAKKNLADPNSWTNSPQRQDFQAEPYDELAKEQTKPLEVASNQHDYSWTVPMFDRLRAGPGRAEEPTFVAAVEPVATASRGGFEVKQATEPSRDRDRGREEDDDRPARGSSTKVEGFRWVAVRAIIPAGRQRDEYIKALNVREPRSTQTNPVYKSALVQRRELTTDGTWSDWQDVNLRANLDVLRRVNLGPVTGPLTSPLPVRGDGEWDDNEIGHPRLQETDPTTGADDQQPDAEQLIVEEPEADTAGSLFGEFGRSTSRAVRPDRRASNLQRQTAQRQRARSAAQQDADDLLRIFDFTAEPGQCYQYRVKLVLENPNYGKSPREVQPIRGAERQPYEGAERETDWSAATAPVCVPPDVTYYVDRFVDSRNGPGGAQIVCVRWTEDDGSFESREITVNPGQVISTKGRTEITTREFVVDLTGGPHRLPQVSDIEELLPAEVLVVNESGEMVVRTELADDLPLVAVQKRLREARGQDRDGTSDDTGTGTRTDFSSGFSGYNQ